MEQLQKHWELVKTPFECRPSILSEIRIIIHDNNRVSVCDTANSTSGTYDIKFNDETTGIITLKTSGWTQRARLWPTSEEYEEGERADNFIAALIRNPIKFELKDDILYVDHKGEKYEFIETS